MQKHIFKIYQIQTKSINNIYTKNKTIFYNIINKN